jgi:hypothetical protein
MEGNKVGRVDLEVKLVDPETGMILWQANHERIERCLFFRPKRNSMTEELLNLLLKEMPH